MRRAQAAKRFASEQWRELRSKLTRDQLLLGWLPGALAVLLFSALVLMASYRSGNIYYDHRLTAADSSCNLTGPALVVSGQSDFSRRDLVHEPAPLHSSDNGTTLYVLQTFVAWHLRAFLPLRPTMAVLLNGVWFVAMGMSLYALFWSRTRRWPTAALITSAFLIANPFLPTITYGLTALDPNLVGFMLGISALCCVILSDHFERVLPSVCAGFFLGALILGRVYTLGIVVPAMLPYVVACFWRRSGEQIERSIVGALFVLGVITGVAGWWVLRFWREALSYPTQYGTQGVLNHTTFLAGLGEWLHFPRLAFAQKLTLVCVLTWPLGAALLAPGASFRRFNWSALWMAVCPMVVLAKMGTTFQPYGAISLLGVFLVALFPFKAARPALVQTSKFSAVLALALALSAWAFFGEQRAAHDALDNNKRGTTNALELMRQHALKAGKKRVKLGLIHWGALHDASLVNALIFDLGVRVATANYEPKVRGSGSLVVEPLATDPWAWDPKVAGKATITAEAWSKHLIDEADYVLVLAGGRSQDRREGRWPPWLDASDRVRASKAFERVGSPFWVPNDGPIELLARKGLGRH